MLLLAAAAFAADIAWYVVPTVAADSDDGVGGGARAEIAWKQEGFDPYRTALMAHVSFTTRGYQHHRLRLDALGLGPRENLRLTAYVAWREWKNDGYWGVGNGTETEEAAATRFRYSLRQPYVHVALRADLAGPWAVVGATALKWSWIGVYEGSLLEEHGAPGGGPSAQAFAGLVHDSRAPEVSPEAGVFAELTARVASEPFAGVFGSVRHYVTVAPRLVFAWRAMGEVLVGDVPFYEMVHWGGVVPVTGFGGFETIRGVPFGRWRAPGKAVANLELRWTVLEHRLGRAPVAWMLVPFADAGAVFGAGDLATAPPPELPVHPAAGGGVRVALDESFVGRLDVGVGLDRTHGRYLANPGFYLAFDHTF